MDIVLTVISLVIPVFMVSFVLYIYRAIKGPTISDQVLAIDALSYDLAAFFIILAVVFRIPILAPVGIVLALWIYALDLYIAKYLEKREMGE